MKGVIYVRLALYLESDVTEDEAQEIVNELDYDVTHPLVSHTEIQEIID